MKTKTVDQLKPEELADLVCILDRAKLGDQTALAELTNALNDYPEISARYGDLGLQALESWVTLIAGKNLLLHETLNRKLDEMKAELTGGTDAPLLEKLMVEQILSTWLQARHVDAFDRSRSESINSESAGQTTDRGASTLYEIGTSPGQFT
jgi:hypothetical protein